MKKKIPKILSVALTVTLVASLFAFAIPASAAPGKHQWAAQTLPTATSNVLYSGSDVTDFAVASDGLTIYVANTGPAPNAAGAVLISTDGGESFSALTVASASASGNMTAIAVAPDDADVVAVVQQTTGGTNDVVHISTNGGKTWSALPVAYDSNVTNATSNIMDVDVGPARAGTVLGREYVIAFADTRASNTTMGDVQIIGAIATWATVGSGTTLATSDVALIHDYVAVKFSPNFVGDRVIAAVGANTTAGDVVLQLINDAQKLQVRAPVGVSTSTAIVDYDSTTGVALALITADIAFPSDFDPSVTSLQRTYIAFGMQTTQTDSDAYRITGSTVRDLDAVTALAIKSIAYTGTVDEGTLFIGEYVDENVKYTLDPTVSIPTWVSTKKAPSADPATTNTTNALTIVRVSPADSNVIYAGTSGTTNLESAFSVSNNAAVSFDAESLIDSITANTVVTVDDIYLTPDGGTIFMATDDGTHLSLWKSDTPTGSTSWSRVRVVTGTTGMVRLNPDWATTPTVFFADLASGGNIYVSTNGGDTYSTRTAPSGVTATDIVVESSSTLYLAVSGTANVQKSTNGAWTWATAVGAKAGTIRTLAMAPSYPATPEAGHLLVGGTTAVSYSTDGGTTFTLISGGLSGTGLLQVMAHEDYATADADGENTLYAGDTSGGTENTFRFVIGTSTSWEDVITGAPDAADVSGLGMVNGVLYSLTDDAGIGGYRTLYPTAAAGTMAWEDAVIGSGTFNRAPSALRVAAGSSILYAINTATTPDAVHAYSDLLATDVPILTAPADGVAINVDSVTGYAQDIIFAWDAMGSGTGLVDTYDIHIAVAGTSFRAPNTASVEPTYATDPKWTDTFNLTSNTEYEWRVRARDQMSNDAIRSGWSASQKFFVQAGGVVQAPQAGVILLGPAAGATNVSLTPGFSWAPIAGATEYEFILATDAGLTNTVEGTPVSVTQPSWQVPGSSLEYSTTYFWAVKATKPTVSVQSIGTFITMAEPVAPPPPPPPVEPPPTPEPITPTYIWAIIIIGAILMIAVIILIVRTRRVV